MGSVPLIVDMHAEDAAIQWVQRDRAVDAPHFNTRLLSRLDERLEANLDGLRVAGLQGWEAAKAAFDQFPESGEMFTLSALAFGAGSARGIGEVLDILVGEPRLLRPAISGLGWLDRSALRGLVQPLFDDRRPAARALGVGACLIHRVDPGPQLDRFLRDDPLVRERALSLVGQLGQDVGPGGPYFAPDDPADCQFRGAWADVRFGGAGAALDHLWQVVLEAGPHQQAGFELAVLASDQVAVAERLKGAENARPLAIRAAGLLGRVDMVPWLLSETERPATAQLAGESFSMITGADLAFLDLDGGDAPQRGTSDDPKDPVVEPDADEDLPMPDPQKLGPWWAQRADSFTESARYYLGRPADRQAYLAGFTDGFQRQRRAAARALALLDPSGATRNWRSRQKLPKGPYHAPAYWDAAG